MERAITDLCQLPDSLLFEEVATGIEHIIDGVHRLDGAARTLSEAKNEYPARILGNLAEEESSKVLILLDFIRCPPNRNKDRSRLLSSFYKHLAKGIYIEVCTWSGVLSFNELKKYIDQARQTHHLDSPNEMDWIFQNKIIQRREDDMYVNYVRDDGGSYQRYWTSPSDDSSNTLFPYHERKSPVISIACSLHEIGATSPLGLSVVAEIWRDIKTTPEFRIDELRDLNYSTLHTLEARDLRRVAGEQVFQSVYQSWPFPLYELDLNQQKVDLQELRAIQQNWTPDW